MLSSLQSRFKTSAAAIMAFGAVAYTTSCINDIDRTQPDKIEKCVFYANGCDGDARTPAEYQFAKTVIDVPSTHGGSFVGYTSDVNRVVFEITEDTLFVYRSQPWLLTNNAEEDGPRADDYIASGSAEGYGSGAAIAAFPITAHFDVQRGYNPATGEQNNVLEENMTDRPWYDRQYMRVDWSMNQIVDLDIFGLGSTTPNNVTVTPQTDGSRNLGNEATQVGHEYVDFVQNWSVGGEIIPGSQSWGWGAQGVPWCLIYGDQDCAGGTIKVRYSFSKVVESGYKPLNYEDTRMGKFGLFRTERYLHDQDYGTTESAVIRLGHRWNMWKDWSCHDEEADFPFANCTVDNIKPIVYHVNEDMPDYLIEASRDVGEKWDIAFKEAIVAGTGWDASRLDNTTVFAVCENNPVQAGDPDYCGAAGDNPQMGDVRYSFLYYIPEDHKSSPLGYGPSHADFMTGELFAGMAYFYGSPARWIARRAIDIFMYDEGLLDIPALTSGDLQRQHVGLLQGEDITTQLIRSRGPLDLDRAEELAERIDLKGKAALLKQQIQSGEAAVDYSEVMKERLKDSDLNSLFASIDEIKKGAGIATLDGEELPAEMFSADKLFGEDLFQVDDARINRFANKRTHMISKTEALDEIFLGFDERYVPLFEEIRERFLDADGVLDEEGATRFIEQRIFIDTQLHEVGHTLGIRHNFAGSADTINFDREWWTLRSAGGNIQGNIMAPEFSVTDPTAFDDSIRQGMRSLQSTAVMEYMSSYGTDTTMGVYETALLKYAYFDAVEIFDTDDPNVNIDKERQELLRPGALHYTFYPDLVSDAPNLEDKFDAIYSRKHINFRKANPDDGVFEVPYKFCSDEYVTGSKECDRWDQGADNYERSIKRINDYRSYYFLDAFKRDRLNFGSSPFDYLSRIFNRTFKPLTNQYKHWVNEEFIVRSDEPCIYYIDGQRVEEGRLFDAEDPLAQFACGIAGFASAADAVNMFSEVISTPNVGCYARLQPGCYEGPAGSSTDGGMSNRDAIVLRDSSPAVCNIVQPAAGNVLFQIEDNSSYQHIGDTTECPKDANGDITFEVTDVNTGNVISDTVVEIPLGPGKPARTLYDRDQYGYYFYQKPTVMGSWWEKWMAVKALYDHDTNFIGVDASADTASFLISLATVFGDDIDNLVGSSIGEASENYGPMIQNGEVIFPAQIALFQNDIDRSDLANIPTVNPDQEYTYRLIAMSNAAYQSAWIADTFTFSEGLRVMSCLTESCLEVPANLKSDPSRYVQVQDPVTGETWYAVKTNRDLGQSGDKVYSPGYDLLRAVKDEFYVGGATGPGVDLLPGVGFGPRGEFRFLKIMNQNYRMFGHTTVGSGDANL